MIAVVFGGLAALALAASIIADVVAWDNTPETVFIYSGKYTSHASHGYSKRELRQITAAVIRAEKKRHAR